jgi:hypothetical protein
MKKQEYFCEYCEKAVPFNARSCPHCGRYFDGVKCPVCFFSGSQELFNDGCPMCGYKPEQEAMFHRENQWVKDYSVQKKEKNGKKGLPEWVYGLAAALLLGIIGAIIFLYVKM